MIAVMRWSLWIGCGILAMLLFTQPVSVQTQSQLALGIIVAMMAIWALWPGQVGLIAQMLLSRRLRCPFLRYLE